MQFESHLGLVFSLFRGLWEWGGMTDQVDQMCVTNWLGWIRHMVWNFQPLTRDRPGADRRDRLAAGWATAESRYSSSCS
jgi:hypothetical protein